MIGSGSTASSQTGLIWAPQAGPQKALIDCPLPEVFFGGARGGGKTDGVLGKWALKEATYGEDFNAVMFRRTTVAAEDAIERSKQIFGPLGAKFNESKLRWRMPNGGRVSFAYLDSVDDANHYQGRNVTDAWVEEAGQYPSPTPIDRLQGVLRSAQGVPTQLICTANPGGPGQHWLRERYQLHPFPARPMVLRRRLANGATHLVAVIPSRITDNRILLDADPGYVNRLHLVGSAELVRAWLEGDWSAVEGAFFDCWSEARHVIRPITLPAGLTRFRSGDWGSAAPFSIGWWAVLSDPLMAETSLGKITLPRGCLVRYREWYGKPGEGKTLTAVGVAKGIREKEKNDGPIVNSVLDPAACKDNGGPSIADNMAGEKVYWRPADNTRVAQRGALSGWDAMRVRLIGEDEGRGPPMIVCFDTCRDSIRTIPVLQHDPDRPEDLDTSSEDHAADDWRYACSSRPWAAAAKTVEPAKRSTGYRSSSSNEPGNWKAN